MKGGSKMTDYTNSIGDYFDRLQRALAAVDRDEINRAMDLIKKSRATGAKIFTMGNGGSGATASHLACDFNKGLSLGKDDKFRVICLCDNTATILAYSNDLSYDDIFVEQIKNFISPGDIVIGFSGSGNSENVVRAARYAKENGCTVIGFTGFDGGRLMDLADIKLHTAEHDMQIAEDVHMILVHMMMNIIYREENPA